MVHLLNLVVSAAYILTFLKGPLVHGAIVLDSPYMSHMDLPSSIPTTRRVGYRPLVLCGSGIDQGQRPCQFNPQLPELVDKSGSDGGSFYKNVAFYEFMNKKDIY